MPAEELLTEECGRPGDGVIAGRLPVFARLGFGWKPVIVEQDVRVVDVTLSVVAKWDGVGLRVPDADADDREKGDADRQPRSEAGGFGAMIDEGGIRCIENPGRTHRDE